MSKRNKVPDQPCRQRYYSGLVAGGVALFLAASAQVASAKTQPEKARTTAALDAKANKEIGKLATQVVQFTRSKSKNISYTHANDGHGEASLTVQVHTGNLVSPGTPAAYNFTVVAPTNHKGNLEPKKARTLVVAEGQSTATNTIIEPYASLVYTKDMKNDSWIFEGEFDVSATPAQSIGLAASTQPIGHEPLLTQGRLDSSTSEMQWVISDGRSPYPHPAAGLPPSFEPIPGASPVPIKG